MTMISPRELSDAIARGDAIDLIDVREAFEFDAVHVAAARSTPLSTLDAAAFLAARGADGANRPLFVICQSGARSAQAAERLRAAGATQVVNVEGGTAGWIAAGLPVVRGRAALTIDRQVRMIIGAAVVAGTALGAWVHPAWLGVPAFFGAGLIWAGATDRCALALVVAKMPWNRGRGATPVACAPGGGATTLSGHA